MKLPSNKEEVYSLKNRDNYRSAFHEDMTEVVVKIAKVFVEYYKRITESTMSAFSMIRGLDTILHVFRYVFLYTKNSDMAYFHCQKAFYYYIEFVDQITKQDIDGLQTRDAVLYVFNKTIFELNASYKKEHSHDARILSCVNAYIDMYASIMIKAISDHANVKAATVEELYDALNNAAGDFGFLQKVSQAVDRLFHCTTAPRLFLCIREFVKKQERADAMLANIKHKVTNDSDEFASKSQCCTDQKFVSWLYTTY